MKVLVALSGGVDSSVAAAELLDAGHHVVGVTMRLWGGDSDTGCCSVADVDDARRVAQQLGIDHLVFNFSDDFNAHVVDPVRRRPPARRSRRTRASSATATSSSPASAERADLLGFDAVATGHHARVGAVGGSLLRSSRRRRGQGPELRRAHARRRRELRRTLFPVGDLTKAQVRERAAALGLRTAAKPDSQDVCFITRPAAAQRSSARASRSARATVVDTRRHGAR